MTDTEKKFHTAKEFATWELRKVSEQIYEQVKEENRAIAALEKSQFVECMRQAVECGDFLKQVFVYGKPNEHTQNAIYIPYQREQELERRVCELIGYLEKHGINPKTGLAEKATEL